MNTFEQRKKKRESDDLKFKKKLIKLCSKEIDWNNIYKSIIHNIFPDNNLTKLLTYQECISNVSKLNVEQINKLKALIESYHLSYNNKPIKFDNIFKYNFIASTKIEKNINKNDIIINVGSSLDKIAFLLEFKNYNIKYIPFSRNYISSETKDKENTLNNNISKKLCKSHYINLLHKYNIKNIKNKKFVIIDYISSGNSIISFINLFCECFQINKDNFLIIGAIDIDTDIKQVKNLLQSFNYKLFRIPDDSYGLSKGTRCVPRLIGTNDKKNIMSNDEIMYCNVVRLLFTYEYMKINKNH
jgi:hypothetical protein